MARVRIVAGGWSVGRLQALMQGQLTDPGGERVADVESVVASGRLSALGRLMGQAITDGVHVIVTTDSRAHRFIAAEQEVPVVALATDGNRNGRARPEALTGCLAPDLGPFLDQQLDCLLALVPTLTSLTVVRYTNQRSPGAADAQRDLVTARIAARKTSQGGALQLRGTITFDAVTDDASPPAVVQHLNDQFNNVFPPGSADPERDGLVVLPCSMASYFRQAIIQNANDRGLKAVYPFTTYANEGGLLSFSPPRDRQAGQLAGMVATILTSQPRQIPAPVDHPLEDYELSLNLTAAGKQGVNPANADRPFAHQFP